MLFNLQTFGFFQISFCYLFLVSMMVRKHTLYDLNPLILIQTCFMTQNIGYLGECFMDVLFLLFLINLFILFIFIFGCVGSSLLHAGFLWLRRAGATIRCGAQASHCSGFSCCGAQALGEQASVVVARGLQ